MMRIHAPLTLLLAALVLFGLAAIQPAQAGKGAAPRRDNPFFPLDNGVGRGVWSPERQAATLKELDYDGIGYNYTNPEDLQKWLKELDARNLKLFEIYFGVSVDKPGVYPAGIRQAIHLLKGRRTILWLTTQGSAKKGNRDAIAARMIEQVADWGEASGLRVALYPHFGMYIATAEDALRVLVQVRRKNVGVTINLCHELKSGTGPRLDEIISQAAPRLMMVTVCGADRGDTASMGWDRLIKPLGQGDYDVYGYLKTLRQAGYHGPIGLQCYQVKGDPKGNLKNSLAAWKKYQIRLDRKGK